MPLINVIRGEAIPTAPFTVRTPVLRLPVWLLVIWQAVKAVVWLVVAYVRFWYVTLPATLLTWLYARFGTTLAISAYFVVVSLISLACAIAESARTGGPVRLEHDEQLAEEGTG